MAPSPVHSSCAPGQTTSPPNPGHTAQVEQVLCRDLIGRGDELLRLVNAIDQAAKGQGEAVLVLGEAGVGKSRLLREAREAARSAGMAVMVGRAVPSSGRTAFRPLAEALHGELRAHGLPQDAELAPFVPVLRQLAPGPEAMSTGIDVDPGLVVGEAVVRLLRAIGGARGCLLVLEDLHWSDPETLAALEYLADNLAGQPAACFASVRSDDHTPALALAATLAARRTVQVLELAPLSAAEVLEMAKTTLGASALPHALETFLRERTDGLPFLVEELLAGLVSSGALRADKQGWTMAREVTPRVPLTFAESVRRRLAAIDEPARRVLLAAAVLGREFDWRLLPPITGLDEAVVLDALHQSVAAQLLTADLGGGDRFLFRHALTRDAMTAELLPPVRAKLASRALEVVERLHRGLPGQWCSLAADLAEEAGDRARAAQLMLEVGGREFAQGSLASAEAALARARELAEGADQLRADASEALTEVLSLAGKADRAFDIGEALLSELPEEEVRRRAGVRLRLAGAAIVAGRWHAASDQLAHVGALQSQSPDEQLQARTDALAAELAMAEARLDEATRLAHRALEAADRAGLPDVACHALEVIGRRARLQSLEDAAVAFSRARGIAERHQLTLWRVRALHELGTIDLLTTESVEHLVQARELAAGMGALALVATLDLQIAAGLIKQFRPDEALPVVTRCAETSRRFRLGTLPMAVMYQAASHAARRERALMEERICEALTLAPDDLDLAGCVWGHCRATLSLIEEDRERALEEMERGMAFLRQSPATLAPPFRGLWALLRTIEEQDGQTACAEVRSSGVTRHWIVGSFLGYADAVRVGRAGRKDDAESAFAEAERRMTPLVDWYRHYGRRLVAEAALHDGWGEPVTWLRAAAPFFHARGHEAVATACRSLLRKGGAVVPRRGRGESSVPEDLQARGVTSREADVLSLLVKRLTNREIATRLYLSPRTVEKHVASLLAKTGCRSRSELTTQTRSLSG